MSCFFFHNIIFDVTLFQDETVTKLKFLQTPRFFGGGRFERIYIIKLQPYSWRLHKIEDSPN